MPISIVSIYGIATIVYEKKFEELNFDEIEQTESNLRTVNYGVFARDI